MSKSSRCGMIPQNGTVAKRQKHWHGNARARPARRPGKKWSKVMSMPSLVSPQLTLSPPRRSALAHIPGNEGWPIVGNTLRVLADPKGHVERNSVMFGPVYRTNMFGETSIVLLGPEANELVLFDQTKLFSSTHGWGPI